jgi:hypothetical protein
MNESFHFFQKCKRKLKTEFLCNGFSKKLGGCSILIYSRCLELPKSVRGHFRLSLLFVMEGDGLALCE